VLPGFRGDAVCRWKDEPPPEEEDARWELVEKTANVDEGIRLFEGLKRELRGGRRKPTA
jgi:hypothetical protein